MLNFLRLLDGRLACFLRYRTSHLDTWTAMIICRDQTQLGAVDDGTALWTDPVRIAPPAPGRHVLLNNHVLRLRHGARAGRILRPPCITVAMGRGRSPRFRHPRLGAVF